MRASVARLASVGAFADCQPAYAALGIPTFPVKADKTPAVRGWQTAGLARSQAWARAMPQAEAFGFCPEKAGITVLDIDAADPAFAEYLFARFGRPVVIARTASGRFHGFYKRAGESRMIRPEGLGVPYDILGGGYSIAPGSVTPKGTYEIVEGTLEDLKRLKPMLADASRRALPRPAANQNGLAIQEGGRNNALLNYLGPVARDNCDTLDDLLDVAKAWAEDNFDTPMTPAEVEKVAKSVWRYQASGTNFIGLKGVGKVLLEASDMDRIRAMSGPGTMDAIGLYAASREKYGGFDEFSIANDAWRDKWTGDLSLARLKRARKILLDAGIIKVKRGHSSKAGAALFSWAA